MHRYSERVIRYCTDPATEIRPWSREELHRIEERIGPLSRRHWELEESLYEATGGRGLPVLGVWVLGVAAALSGVELPLVTHGFGDRHGTLFASSGHCGLYVFPSGEVEDSRGSAVGRDAFAVVERLVLLLDSEWLPVQAIFTRRKGSELADKLKLRKLAEASDGWVEVWLKEGLLLVADDLRFDRARVATFDALTALLRGCAASGAPVYLESSAPVTVRDSDDMEYSSALEKQAQCIVRDDGERLLASDPASRTALQATIRRGRVLERTTFREEVTEIVRYAAASRYLSGLVSPRVARFCDIHGMFRDPALSCGFDALAAELDQRGLPFHDAWFDFEERFGGIVWESARRGVVEMSLGICQCLTASPDDAPAWRIRSTRVTPDIWPTARHGEAHLILAGAMENFDDQIFVDERGVVYRLAGLLDELSAEATDGRLFLEKMAAEWEMHALIEESAPAMVHADVAEALVPRLALSEITDASDAISRVFRSEQLWVWRRLAFPPNAPSTTLVARTPRALVEALRIAHDAAPDADISVRRDLPGGRERIAALRAAGMKVREMF
ncbi:hypothetical protein [Sorangium sp. So ce1024]|uniref:hypothetical protein n=1 Tax=unclassified Sorangium TaxID=2621164 RepID=UPI003F0D39F7